jgi:hypothetical protein
VGILPDELFSAAANKSYAEYQKQREVDARVEARMKNEADAYAAELQRRRNEINRFAERNMAPQLRAQQVVLHPIDEQHHRDLLEYCADNNWPIDLPIMPHALYEYLVTESIKGYEHILAIANSVAKVHEVRAPADMCPSRTHLVQALLELAREEEEQQHSN